MKIPKNNFQIASILLLALLAVGCGHPKQRLLVGKWKMEAADDAWVASTRVAD